MNCAELAEKEGKGISTIAKRWEKNFPGVPFSRFSELTEEQIFAISKESGKKNMDMAVIEKKQTMKQSPNPAVPNEVPPGKKKVEPKTPWILYGLMFVPAVASIQNMHSVTGDLTGFYSGWVLTVLFSLAPFAFIVVGLRGVFVSALTFLMIAYECFCNTMRIYGGLTRFGLDGYPTRFLGLVTDFCNSGTYATARVLSVFMALIAAGVFYAAYLQLNKK
jgi:hypothetical protein